MIFVVISIVLGIVIGMFLPIPPSSSMSMYFAVGIFAALDSVVGALRAQMQGNYDQIKFITGFLMNSLVATLLAYVGDRLGLPLYYAAIFVFGTRLFNNISTMRNMAIDSARKVRAEMNLSKNKSLEDHSNTTDKEVLKTKEEDEVAVEEENAKK